MTQLIFKVFRVGLPRLPHQINSVRDLGHEPLGKAEAPVAIFIIGGRADGVAARVGCVVVGAVVVDGPVGELKVGIRANRIDIKKIHHAELSEADFQPAARQFLKERKGIALVFYFVPAQRKYVVNHAPRQIRRFAQERIAHDIEICIARQPKARTEGGSAGFFNVHQNLGGIAEPHAGVQGQHARRGFLVVRAQAVLPAVGRVEWRMGLENEIYLPRKPEARVPETSEHRFRALVCWRVSGRAGLIGDDRMGRGIQLRCGGPFRLLRERRERSTKSRPEDKHQPACAEIHGLSLLRHIPGVETSHP